MSVLLLSSCLSCAVYLAHGFMLSVSDVSLNIFSIYLFFNVFVFCNVNK